MSDDRFGSRTVEEEEPEPPPEPHEIRMLAFTQLRWDEAASRWEMREPAELEPDPELICTGGLHLDSPLDRAKCDVAKERARGARLPSRRAVADAFTRAADAPRTWQPLDGPA